MTILRQSQLFLPLRKENPHDEESANAQMLVRGGFIDKLHAGVYSFLPLGLRVLYRIERIIREEMNKIGGQELLLPAMHPKENWEKTGRLKTYDPPLYTVSDSRGREYILAPTHEEVIVPLVKTMISSYRDLPLALYQFQTKFRNELRAKSGLLRGREFIMKDLYSFHADDEDMLGYYEQVKSAYRRIFERVGIGDKTYLTFASGGTFSKYSHEFQTLNPAGEDTIYLCEKCGIAINNEIINDQKECPSCNKSIVGLRKERAIEVGNIFPLKTKYSEPFGLNYVDAEGSEKLVVMGCYGIGLGRLIAAIVEVHHDEHGICWPKEVAPADIHLLALGKDAAVLSEAEKLAKALQDKGFSVLYDDRADVRAGEKLASADLIGMPLRVVVSEKSLKENKIEIKKRNKKESSLVSFDEAIHQLSL